MKITIGTHCTVTSSKRFHLSERAESGVPFFCSKQIIQLENGEIPSDYDHITNEHFRDIQIKYGVPSAGDLLITTRGTYGIPYIYKERDCFYFADGNLTWLKDFDDCLSSHYLYYWFKSYEGQKKIDAIAKGTAQKAVPIALIKDLQLSLPPISQQKRIASILSAYDDLIENNRRQIKLLEEAAQRLYREWFVELRFPGHESVKVMDGVPEGWKRVKIKDLIAYEIGGGWGSDAPSERDFQEAYVIRGTDLHGIMHGDYKNLPLRFHSENSLKPRILQDGDIVFEVSGGGKNEGVARTALISTQLLSLLNKPAICASFCKLIRPIEIDYSQYMYSYLQFLRASGKTAEYDKRSASSIVNYRWKDFLVQEYTLLPELTVLKHFNRYIDAYYKKITTCANIISIASDTRDRLLSKLMSREMEV
jgi:type I restriction enzyme S subunit